MKGKICTNCKVGLSTYVLKENKKSFLCSLCAKREYESKEIRLLTYADLD